MHWNFFSLDSCLPLCNCISYVCLVLLGHGFNIFFLTFILPDYVIVTIHFSSLDSVVACIRISIPNSSSLFLKVISCTNFSYQ